ncbi:hypothetical protein AVEN_138342-1 [Araneus ventricosus]|uniref:Uncharacterized protein n=1 Tax=Araneus ventricosus TaxID=182803 RepID=A0A4Y1ZU97_ARAVE|nr:hypothetical protein AVEN_138342-1 [Araneus ventricosus]
MDYIYPEKPFQNTINVLAASILNENLITSDIETTLLASETSLRHVQSCREIGVLYSTERDPNRLEKWVRESHLSLTGGKSDVSQPNRGYQNRPVNNAIEFGMSTEASAGMTSLRTGSIDAPPLV